MTLSDTYTPLPARPGGLCGDPGPGVGAVSRGPGGHICGGGGRAVTSLDGRKASIPTSGAAGSRKWEQKRAETVSKISSNLQRTLKELGEDDLALRVGACGGWVVMECTDCGGRSRFKYACGHKLCGGCAGVRRWRKVQDLWPLVQTFKNPRFLTLTFKSFHRLTRERRVWMAGCLRRFLKTKWVKEKIGGGVWAWETTYNQRLKMWHPHFHLLFDGAYLPHADVKALWREITGGAFIVDIRPIVSRAAAAAGRPPTDEEKKAALRETVKYITKAIQFSDDPALVRQFLDATHGMRRTGLFGKAYNYKPPEPPPTDKRYWQMDPFTGRGFVKFGCGCGRVAFPEFWGRVGELHTKEEAERLCRIKGEPQKMLDPCPW